VGSADAFYARLELFHLQFDAGALDAAASWIAEISPNGEAQATAVAAAVDLLLEAGATIPNKPTSPRWPETKTPASSGVLSGLSVSAYPNPFNPVTRVTYTLEESTVVTVSIFDLLGREVALLVDGWQSPGVHELVFDGSDQPTGTYVVVVSTGETAASTTLVLLR